MEFTPNFNANAGGFLVDPNAGEFGGTFGVAIGTAANRNSVFFARPSAGAWHHYAIVINTTAAAARSRRTSTASRSATRRRAAKSARGRSPTRRCI